MALRMRAETGAPVFSESAFSFFCFISSSQIVVRFMHPLVRLQTYACQSVPKLYPTRGTVVTLGTTGARRISKLRVFNTGKGFESHPLRHFCKPLSTKANWLLRQAMLHYTREKGLSKREGLRRKTAQQKGKT